MLLHESIGLVECHNMTFGNFYNSPQTDGVMSNYSPPPFPAEQLVLKTVAANQEVGTTNKCAHSRIQMKRTPPAKDNSRIKP